MGKNISENIEKILRLAASDKDFKKLLLEDMESAVKREGLFLNHHDKMLLMSITSEGLASVIESFSRQNLENNSAVELIPDSSVRMARAEDVSGAGRNKTYTLGIRPDFSPARGVRPYF